MILGSENNNEVIVLKATNVKENISSLYDDYIAEIVYSLYGNGNLHIETIYSLSNKDDKYTKLSGKDFFEMEKLLNEFDGGSFSQIINTGTESWEITLEYKKFDKFSNYDMMHRTQFRLGYIQGNSIIEKIVKILEIYNEHSAGEASIENKLDSTKESFMDKIKNIFKRN